MLVVRRGAAAQGDGRAASAALRTGHRVALAVVATCLLTVLVAWAALIGPQQVFTGPGHVPGTGSVSATEPPPETQTAAPPPAGSGDAAPRPDPPGWWVGLVIFLMKAGAGLGVLLGLVVVACLVWDLWDRRRRRDEEVPGVDFAALDTSTRIEDEVRADTAEQDALLQGGTPRNAIVAAWHRFELQGERAGLPRKPSETSSEFTLRLLDLVGADSAAVLRLGDLYREARFSGHELDEHHRAAAVDALAAIRASMGAQR